MPTPAPDWEQGFADTYPEHITPVPLPVEGELPAGLRGTLLRNGPGQMSTQGERIDHWFDGDGMIHAVHFTDAGITYNSRFVDTAQRRIEQAAGKRLFSGYGVTARGGPLGMLRGLRHKNPANTHVVVFAQKLLALCEAGLPYRLDPTTLATLEQDRLGGGLRENIGFSAHPKLHPRTGEMWNFGIAYGRESHAILYRCNAQGQAEERLAVPMPWNSLVHDFALTDKYAILAFAPLFLPAVPWQVMTGLRPFERGLQWDPARGTQLAVVDLEEGHIRQLHAPPFFAFHTANAWDDDNGAITLDLCAYPDAGFMDLLRGMTRHHLAEAAPAIPTRIVIGNDNDVTCTPLTRAGLEFPRVIKSDLTRAHHEIYGVTWDPNRPDFAKIPACVDTDTGAVQIAPMAPGEYAGECVPVGIGDGPDETYLLSVVLNAAKQRSEVRIYRAADMQGGAVCVIPLPHVVPFGFHGNWLPATPNAVAIS